jgi:polyphosphate:AMP phosphotransferase
MLDQVDLKQKLPRNRYKELMPELDIRLGTLQRRAIQANLPVVLLFEGWEAAGKGELINRVVRVLDPRHFTVIPVDELAADQFKHPHPWRFWTRIPARGRMTVFDRGFGRKLLRDRLGKGTKKDKLRDRYEEINSFVRQLTADGYVIIRLFLHISEKEHLKRFDKLKHARKTGCAITETDRLVPRDYKKLLRAVDDLLENTHTEDAPWHVIAAEDRRFATVTIFETICRALEKSLNERDTSQRSDAAVDTVDATMKGSEDSARTGEGILDNVDLLQTVSHEEYGKRLDRYQAKMGKFQYHAYKKEIPVVIVYEGWDAAGKGGNIKRLTQGLDPRGYEVVPIAAPNDIEKRHHYLWRFWREMPKAGRITIFDRSWYGRVMVERVEGFCTEAEWRRAYDEINEMEYQLTRFGTVLVKFWIHIDREEQLKRFKEREKTPHKQWKITDEDWRNREKWDAYKVAVEEMLARTSTKHAPWTIVESNSKHFARLKALKTVIGAIKKKL